MDNCIKKAIYLPGNRLVFLYSSKLLLTKTNLGRNLNMIADKPIETEVTANASHLSYSVTSGSEKSHLTQLIAAIHNSPLQSRTEPDALEAETSTQQKPAHNKNQHQDRICENSFKHFMLYYEKIG